MTNAVRDQMRGRRSGVKGRVGKAGARRTLNRSDRRRAKLDLRAGFEPSRRPALTLEGVLT